MSSEVEGVPLPTTTTTTNAPASTGVESDKSIHDSEEYESAEEIEGESVGVNNENELGPEDEEDADGLGREDEEDELQDELGEEEEELEEIEVEVEEEVDDEDEEGESDEGEQEASKGEKPLDDDQDRKNPQFIPKKGYFYEHDDRTAEEGGENETETKIEPEQPKKAIKTFADRWSHDLYDENEQTPKSNDELKTRYGYDIRTEETAPRARRHKRYSRGPSTYTRKWDDEAAYQKPRGGFRGGDRGTRGRGGFQKPVSGTGRHDSRNYEEDFPELHDRRSGGGGGGSTGPKTNTNKVVTAAVDKQKKEKTPEKEKPQSQNRRRSLDSTGDDKQLPSNRDSSFRKHQHENRRISDESSGRGRGGGNNRRIFHGSKQFTNRNRYPDRRSDEYNRSNPINAKDNSTSDDQKSWAQQVERIRETEKSTKSPKPQQQHANGSTTNSNDNKSPKSNSTSFGSSSSSSHKNAAADGPRKSVQPFTNTEYTGSASLTAKRNEQHQYAPNRAVHQQPNPPQDRRNENDYEERSGGGGHRVVINNSNYSSDKNSSAPRSQQQQQSALAPAPESTKPKRFSSQRQRQQNQDGSTGNVNVRPNSSSPPAGSIPQSGGGPPLQPQQVHLGGPSNVTLVTATGQIITPGVPVSVMSGYPPAPAYYEPVPTSYDTQGYETSGSPITAVPGHGGSSGSPSLWPQPQHQHPAYATGPPYPSPPTGPPQMQQPYDSNSPYLPPGQPQQIFAPPPHPHPQYIQDPTIINYAPPGPPAPFPGPPFHPQQFPGYPQVPPGPPEMYGGITYYSPQNQMQRPPPQHIIVQTQSKRGTSRLQLVEPSRQRPPRTYQTREEAEADMYQMQQQQQHYGPGPSGYPESGGRITGPEMETYEQAKEGLSEKLQDTLTLNPETEQRRKKSPSPAPLEIAKPPPEPESWADQVSEMTPINSPVKTEGSMDFSKDE